jgi:F420-non-reducing hydrogenase iron-sulfur subunit
MARSKLNKIKNRRPKSNNDAITKSNSQPSYTKNTKNSKSTKKLINKKYIKDQRSQKETAKGKKVDKKDFEPRILAFCCNWCSYAGADLAGVSRIQYPPNVRIIRVMCSGRIEPAHIFSAIESGAHGVIISGCHPGDCHYISGNLRAEEMIKKLHKLFNIIGFDDRRVRLQWISASEGQLFAEKITEFVELIKRLGPMQLVDSSKFSISVTRSKPNPNSDKGIKTSKSGDSEVVGAI